jgi:hypothetical protein
MRGIVFVVSWFLCPNILGAFGTHQTGGCPSADLRRAKQRVPRAGWKGSDFAKMAMVLTSRLSSGGHNIRPCVEWTVAELQHLQRRLFNESHLELLIIYDQVGDNRRQRFKTLAALEAHWAGVDAAAAAAEGLNEIRRDGLCHETVMWAVHHIPSMSLKSFSSEGLVLPSLPVVRHEASAGTKSLPKDVADASRLVHSEYEQQVSCQQCHTGTIVDAKWQNASLPGPEDIPVPKKDLELEKLRRCNFRNHPSCGPCDGLGGRRWGDGPEEFTPMKCEVIHGPEVAPTTRGCYPSLGSASLTGETREPLEVFPTPTSKPGRYPSLNGTISMGDADGVMRLRYDFGRIGTQLSAQTLKQAEAGNVGATAGMMSGGSCACEKSIAGNFHACSFEANDTLDPLKLPGSEGGAAYLGRVRVTLDGDVAASQRVAIADHFLKWAFHFLVDADKNSSTFGLPLRLYGAGGVRQVFHGWKVGDPTETRPDVWTLPKGCKITAPECSVFQAPTQVDDSTAVLI